MKNNIFKILPNAEGIFFIKKSVKVLFGMTKNSVDNLFGIISNFHSKVICKYPQNKIIIEYKYIYKEFSLYMTFIDDSLELIQFNGNKNSLQFDNIELTNNDYKNTLENLKKMKVDITKNSVPVCDEYFVNKLCCSILIWEGKFDVVNVYSKNFLARRKNDLNNFLSKMSRDEDDNVVIRYTKIKK